MSCGLCRGLEGGRIQTLGEDGPSTAQGIWQHFAVEGSKA